MKILFIHQNFPGQFKHLAPALSSRGHEVKALAIQNRSVQIPGVEVFYYKLNRVNGHNIHPWVIEFETKIIRAEACFEACQILKSNGYRPDVIIAHPGWGESLFVKDVWSEAKLGIYSEFYYSHEGVDVNFDPEFESNHDAEASRFRIKNINNSLHFEIADAGISPTAWQASTYPPIYRRKIKVVHDGIDTNILQKKTNAEVAIQERGATLNLSQKDEVVTFVSRNLEPYRGYHILMRALPTLLSTRPNLRILIVGAEGAGYGAKPDEKKYGNESWKSIYFEEIKNELTQAQITRIHFMGQVQYEKYLNILSISTVHVYLTYPFVLSWSLLESMSLGCAIVASDTAPVKEVIENGIHGVLTDFFDSERLAIEIEKLIEDKLLREVLGQNARRLIVEKYDLESVCLPHQIAWIEELGAR